MAIDRDATQGCHTRTWHDSKLAIPKDKLLVILMNSDSE
jgi:hypothetical protein